MTAEQMLRWAKDVTGLSRSELDRALLEGWEADPRFSELKIRPAKYPSFDLYRLWGHEDVVESPPRTVIDQRRRDCPSRFEGPATTADADLIFLSHSTLDLEFALRVRGTLAKHNIRAWLAEEEIEQGAPIIETVREAVERSRRTVVAIGRNALGSAWVDTESVGGGRNVSPVVVLDGEDGLLMDLLGSWYPPNRSDETNFDMEYLVKLQAAYRAAWNVRRESKDVLDRGAGGLSVRKERPKKFPISARNLLFSLGCWEPSIYPELPREWKGDRTIRGFEEVVASILTETQ